MKRALLISILLLAAFACGAATGCGNDVAKEINNDKAELIRPEGYDDMDIYDKYVVDVLDSKEFKELCDLYRENLGGPILKHLIPRTETLSGFKAKVEESIETGYDVFPEAYNLQIADAWMGTKRYEEVNEKYKSIVSGGIPMMQIGAITMDDLEKLVDECVKQNKDLFPEYFKWDEDPPDIVY